MVSAVAGLPADPPIALPVDQVPTVHSFRRVDQSPRAKINMMVFFKLRVGPNNVDSINVDSSKVDEWTAEVAFLVIVGHGVVVCCYGVSDQIAASAWGCLPLHCPVASCRDLS